MLSGCSDTVGEGASVDGEMFPFVRGGSVLSSFVTGCEGLKQKTMDKLFHACTFVI